MIRPLHRSGNQSVRGDDYYKHADRKASSRWSERFRAYSWKLATVNAGTQTVLATSYRQHDRYAHLTNLRKLARQEDLARFYANSEETKEPSELVFSCINK